MFVFAFLFLMAFSTTEVWSQQVYSIQGDRLEVEQDRGQSGLRDIVPPRHQKTILDEKAAEAAKKKQTKELERSKMTLNPLRVKGRVARPRIQFHRLEPEYVDTQISDESIGLEQGRWDLHRESRTATQGLRVRQ